MSQANNILSNMSPKTKRMLAIGGTVLAVGTVIGIAMHNATPERKERSAIRPTVEAVLTDQDPRAQGLDAMASQLRQLQTAQNRIERTINQKQVERTSRGAEEKITSLEAQIKQMHEAMAEMQEKIASAPVAMPAQEAQTSSEDSIDSMERTGMIPTRTPHMPTTATAEPEALTNIYQNLPEPPPLDPTSRTSERTEAPKIRSIRNQRADEKQDKNEEVTITIPSGSILSGVLMTGMDAPTGNQAQRDPFPTLLRIKHEAILPNRFRADFRECFLVAAGWGDLSSERAYMRAERISCVRYDGTVLESTLDAYATGEDGKAGVRGRLVSKQGQVIARSLMAGFMQGVSGAFDVRQVPSINISRGNDGSVNSPVYEQAFNSNVAQAAGARGVSSAMERIADYYLAMAENIFPIIEIDAMREVDFIVKRGMTVKLSSADALTQISVN